MKIIIKREYFDPNWEAKRLEPKTCKRRYVQLDNGQDIGPFDTHDEAANWMRQERTRMTIALHNEANN